MTANHTTNIHAVLCQAEFKEGSNRVVYGGVQASLLFLTIERFRDARETLIRPYSRPLENEKEEREHDFHLKDRRTRKQGEVRIAGRKTSARTMHDEIRT